MGFAVPYMYEDYLPQSELNRLPVTDPVFHEYAVVHANPNRTVTSYIIPALVGKDAESKDDEAPIARGRNPQKLIDGYQDKYKNFPQQVGLAYKIMIEFEEKTPAIEVIGQVPHDVIYKDNTQNETARALSGGGATFKDRAKNVLKGGLRRALKDKEDSYIFWPGVDSVIDHNIRVPLRGSFRIDLHMMKRDRSGVPVSFVRGGYSLPRAGKDTMSAASRKVQQIFRSQIEMKFKGTRLTTKNLYVRRYSDFEGNGVILTFQIGEGEESAQLVDVEYIVGNLRTDSVVRNFQVPAPLPNRDDSAPEPPADTTGLKDPNLDLAELDKREDEDAPLPEEPKLAQIHCNASDYDHVVGLAMALDFHIATNADEFESEKLKQLEQSCAIIKDYAHTMEANNGAAPEHIPNNVSTAINHAVDSLYYEPIGLQSRWEIMITRNPTTVLEKTKEIIAKLTAGDALTGLKRAQHVIKRNTVLIPQLKKIRAAANRIQSKSGALMTDASAEKKAITEIIAIIDKFNPGFAT